MKVKKKIKTFFKLMKEKDYYKIRNILSNKFINLSQLPRLSKRFHSHNLIDSSVYEVNLTSECNLRCLNCCSSCPQAPSKEYMSIRQIEKFLKEIKPYIYKSNIKKIKLYGGEPTLHPRFGEMICLFKKFKKEFPSVNIILLTNGTGKIVKSKLRKVPKEIEILDSTKEGFEKKYSSFVAFNQAPCDDKKYKNSKFENGCPVISGCGICISKAGYYVCATGYHIDRVFGMNIGIKKRKDLNEKNMREQLKKLCPFCGRFKEPQIYVKEQTTSKTWSRAYERYKKNKPLLSEY
jgi:organic radical activating enzyme